MQRNPPDPEFPAALEIDRHDNDNDDGGGSTTEARSPMRTSRRPSYHGVGYRARAFGTQGSNLSFPMEHCSFFAVSRKSKTPLPSLVTDSFAEARGDYDNNPSDA
jgi:hypothetical protein